MQIEMLKKILPGLLPLFIYIVAEEIWGATIGLYVALGTGILQLVYFYVKDKRIDKFVLFDTSLILILGLVSIIFDNNIFFKLKPALIESILLFLIAFSLFSSHNVVLKMSKRYLQDGIEIKQEQENAMRKQMMIMLAMLVVHIALIIYSAYFMSEAAWAFISGALFYILIGFWAVFMFVYTRIKMNCTEWLPVVNDKGEVLGKASREECHNNPDLLHPVVRIHIFRKDGKLLLQKRSKKSEVEPGKWDAACAGHVQYGENAEQALARELHEEVGLKIDKYQAIHQRIFRFEKNSELVLLYFAISDEPGKANPKEVEEIDNFSIEDIERMKDSMTGAILEEVKLLKQIRKTIILA